MPWGIPEQVLHLQKLLAPGVLGTYNSFEVTEIVGFEARGPATNFFSILVAEPALAPASVPDNPFINDRPVPLRTTDWKFGVARYRITTQQALAALQCLQATGEWKLGNNALKVGQLKAVTPQFVPSDSAFSHPWNSVLKNNFWDGSHVVEMFDVAKQEVSFLLAEPKLLTDLVTLIRPFAAIGIDGLSDRLGNVLFQIPVTVATTAIRGSAAGNIMIQPSWRPLATPRPLRASFERYKDGTVDDFSSKSVQSSGQTTFPLHAPGGGPRYVVWDDVNEVIVGASAPTVFITRVGIGFHVDGAVGGHPREFNASGADGQPQQERVALLQELERTQVIDGRPEGDPREPWRSSRIFKESLIKLQQSKEFVQYGGPSGLDRQQALADLRWLINAHGKGGAWLWDPYLGASDVLSTLFYCHHRGADLRALTSGQEPPTDSKPPAVSKPVVFLRSASRRIEQYLTTGQLGKWLARAAPVTTWTQRQHSAIETDKGNCEGLQLEFRIREGQAGWSFHDRFLIFPGTEPGGATAWSLGTSVNSLGRQHHILQKVSDGERIRQAFLELWNDLSGPEYLVWSSR